MITPFSATHFWRCSPPLSEGVAATENDTVSPTQTSGIFSRPYGTDEFLHLGPANEWNAPLLSWWIARLIRHGEFGWRANVNHLIRDEPKIAHRFIGGNNE